MICWDKLVRPSVRSSFLKSPSKPEFPLVAEGKTVKSRIRSEYNSSSSIPITIAKSEAGSTLKKLMGAGEGESEEEGLEEVVAAVMGRPDGSLNFSTSPTLLSAIVVLSYSSLDVLMRDLMRVEREGASPGGCCEEDVNLLALFAKRRS